MDIYLKLFEVLFPVFFIVGIGFLLGKKNPNFDTSFITTYAGNFGTPALVIFAITAGGVTFEVFKEFFFLCFNTSKCIWCSWINFFSFNEKRLYKRITNIYFT